MEWMTANEAAELWGVTNRQVQILCTRGRVDGAQRLGNMWVIPKGAPKPRDGRYKNGRVAAKDKQADKEQE